MSTETTSRTITPEQYKAHGFRLSFGTWTRTTDLHVCITVGKRATSLPDQYGVYVFHGHPGGQFWRNDSPLVRCDTLPEAMRKAATLYGITGSEQFATIIEI